MDIFLVSWNSSDRTDHMTLTLICTSSVSVLFNNHHSINDGKLKLPLASAVQVLRWKFTFILDLTVLNDHPLNWKDMMFDCTGTAGPFIDSEHSKERRTTNVRIDHAWQLALISRNNLPSRSSLFLSFAPRRIFEIFNRVIYLGGRLRASINHWQVTVSGRFQDLFDDKRLCLYRIPL